MPQWLQSASHDINTLTCAHAHTYSAPVPSSIPSLPELFRSSALSPVFSKLTSNLTSYLLVLSCQQDQQLSPSLLRLCYTQAVGLCSAGEGTVLPVLGSPLTPSSPLFVNSPALGAPQQKTEIDQKNKSLRASVFLDLDDDTVHWEKDTFFFFFFNVDKCSSLEIQWCSLLETGKVSV